MGNKFHLDINKLNMLLAWISIFGLSWLVLLDIVPLNLKSESFAIFFFLVAFFAGGSDRRN
jgi:hypothetical protein